MLFLGRIAHWFRDRHRNIFLFWDGTRWRRADPLAVGTRLEEVCPDYLALLETIAGQATSAPPGALRDDLLSQQKGAAKKLASAAQQVFGLTPLDDTKGVTGAEAIGVLTRYFLFMEELAAAAELFPDSRGPASDSRPDSATEPSAVFGTAGN